MQLKVLALGGDGIGPEVVDAGLKVLECAAKSIDLVLDISEDLLHGAAWERYGTFYRCGDSVLQKSLISDIMSYGLVTLLRCQFRQRRRRRVGHVWAWFRTGKGRVLFCTQAKWIEVTTRFH